MRNVRPWMLACKLRSSPGLKLECFTYIESGNLSLKYQANCYHFFVYLQNMTVNDSIPSATTAASRSRTSRQQVCPATLLSTSKQALIPIGQSHNICSCQTPFLNLARHCCCYAAGCSVLHAEVPLWLGASETAFLDLCSLQWICTFGL